MSDQNEPQTTSAQQAKMRLHEVANRLRQAGPLDPESQRALAALIDELGESLETGAAPAPQVTHLAQSTLHLVESLHEEDRGLLGKARDRLEWAVCDAEAHAPITVGLARKLLDFLGNIGI